jgi:hypothetical protein
MAVKGMEGGGIAVSWPSKQRITREKRIRDGRWAYIRYKDCFSVSVKKLI